MATPDLPFPCCEHCGCGMPGGIWDTRDGHDDMCRAGCNDAPVVSVPDRWVELFGKGWHSVSEGKPGDRRRAGLALVLADLRRQVEAIREGTDSAHDDLWAFQKVLDLLDTGGSDE